MLGKEASESLFLTLLTEDVRSLILAKLSLEEIIQFSSVSKKARNFVNEQLKTEQFQTILKNQFAKEFYKFFSFAKGELTVRGSKLEAANPWLVKAFLLAFAEKLDNCEQALTALENSSTDLSRALLAQFGRASGLPSLADFKLHLNECKQALEDESKKAKPSVNIGFRDNFSYYLKWMAILNQQLIYYAIRTDGLEDGLEDVKDLLALGADVNAKNTKGYTALMGAAIKGHTAIVRALLAKEGIDVNAKDNEGYTALMCAAKRGQEATVSALREAQGATQNNKWRNKLRRVYRK